MNPKTHVGKTKIFFEKTPAIAHRINLPVALFRLHPKDNGLSGKDKFRILVNYVFRGNIIDIPQGHDDRLYIQMQIVF